jgi:hypothetical protein
MVRAFQVLAATVTSAALAASAQRDSIRQCADAAPGNGRRI